MHEQGGWSGVFGIMRHALGLIWEAGLLERVYNY